MAVRLAPGAKATVSHNATEHYNARTHIPHSRGAHARVIRRRRGVPKPRHRQAHAVRVQHHNNCPDSQDGGRLLFQRHPLRESLSQGRYCLPKATLVSATAPRPRSVDGVVLFDEADGFLQYLHSGRLM